MGLSVLDFLDESCSVRLTDGGRWVAVVWGIVGWGRTRDEALTQARGNFRGFMSVLR